MLFNIFIEDLANELAQELGINEEDILLYADDVFVTCNLYNQIHKAIGVIGRWTDRNGMELEKKKFVLSLLLTDTQEMHIFLSKEKELSTNTE